MGDAGAVMNLRNRYRRLSFWNKIAFWGSLASLAALLLAVVLLAVPWLRKEPFVAPQFTVKSLAPDLSTADEAPVPLSRFASMRLHLLEIKNLNAAPLSGMRLWTQWPEPIVSATADAPGREGIAASENWDRQPLQVTGDIPPSASIEPFASDERTGLWEIVINSVPPDETLRIEILSITGPMGGFYDEAAREIEIQKSNGEIAWLIHGNYQHGEPPNVMTEQVLVPLEFDRTTRTLRALAPEVGESSGEMQRIELRHGRGFRLAGILETRGYLLVKARSGTRFIAPIRLERTEDIAVKLGVFGWPPVHPGLQVTVRARKSTIEPHESGAQGIPSQTPNPGVQ